MSHSGLVSYFRQTKNCGSREGYKIKGFAIHCFVGQVTAQRGVDYFAETDRDASANYVIGYDGQIGCSVDDDLRSWCTSNGIDKQLITIEMASEAVHPYKVTDAAYKSLINLLVDRCQAYGIQKLMWREDREAARAWDLSTQNLVVHRWFDNKACPGDYLYNLHYQIAEQVNARLGSGQIQPPSDPSPAPAQEPDVDWCEPTVPIIGFDDDGNAVEMLQAMLIQRGYDLPDYGADGVFGEETERAVFAFQEDDGLDVDGVVGPQTWGALLEY